ncbi:GPAT2 acyltransferase, partial [Piaya cayana]|nr:GPAT2 acyltransferase [Piaya cayana]
LFSPQMSIWVCSSGQRVEIFIPFLGKCRPPLWRCCQTCTLRSWPGKASESWNVAVSLRLPRYRGWLVRRVCGLVAAWGWKIPAD